MTRDLMQDPCARCGYDPVWPRKRCPACLAERVGEAPEQTWREPGHGTMTRWGYGCRCIECRETRRRYDRRRRARA